MNWRHVFDCSKRVYFNREQACALATEAGYGFMNFNGIIYMVCRAKRTEVLYDYSMKDTGLKVEDCY